MLQRLIILNILLPILFMLLEQMFPIWWRFEPVYTLQLLWCCQCIQDSAQIRLIRSGMRSSLITLLLRSGTVLKSKTWWWLLLLFQEDYCFLNKQLNDVALKSWVANLSLLKAACNRNIINVSEQWCLVLKGLNPF